MSSSIDPAALATSLPPHHLPQKDPSRPRFTTALVEALGEERVRELEAELGDMYLRRHHDPPWLLDATLINKMIEVSASAQVPPLTKIWIEALNPRYDALGPVLQHERGLPTKQEASSAPFGYMWLATEIRLESAEATSETALGHSIPPMWGNGSLLVSPRLRYFVRWALTARGHAESRSEGGAGLILQSTALDGSDRRDEDRDEIPIWSCHAGPTLWGPENVGNEFSDHPNDPDDSGAVSIGRLSTSIINKVRNDRKYYAIVYLWTTSDAEGENLGDWYGSTSRIGFGALLESIWVTAIHA
jgi:hypothetical protein